MPHRYTFKVNPDAIDRTAPGALEDDRVVSDAARQIHESFKASGKLTDESEAPNDDGTYTTTFIFTDSATCDEYLAEMAKIDEMTTSGASRSEHLREDI